MKPSTTLRPLAFVLAALPLSGGLSPASAKPSVEVACVLDTTGSMGGLIEGAKRKIWSIATSIVDTKLAPDDATIRTALRGAAAYKLSWFDANLWAYAEHWRGS